MQDEAVAVAPAPVHSEVVIADMPETVLDGSLGEICQARMQGFPLAYSWGTLVTAASALVPTPLPEGVSELDEQGHTLTVKPQNIRPNLYWCAVGEKGTGKSSSMDKAFKILGLKEPTLMDSKVGSGEGLVQEMEEANGETRILFPDELSHTLEKANMDNASLAFILNTAFYRDTCKLVTKGKTLECHARLSIIGGTTVNLFHDSFGPKTADGLYDRFLFGRCPEPFQFDYTPSDDSPEHVVAYSQDVSPDVWEAKSAWLKAGIAARVAEICLRVAYVCACCDQRTLEAKDLAPALALAQYEMNLREFLQPSPAQTHGAKIEFAVRQHLKSKPGQWVYRSELYRISHASRYGLIVFERSMLLMTRVGEIERRREGNKELYRFVQ